MLQLFHGIPWVGQPDFCVANMWGLESSDLLLVDSISGELWGIPTEKKVFLVLGSGFCLSHEFHG